jgi:hypothetical protein
MNRIFFTANSLTPGIVIHGPKNIKTGPRSISYTQHIDTRREGLTVKKRVSGSFLFAAICTSGPALLTGQYRFRFGNLFH